MSLPFLDRAEVVDESTVPLGAETFVEAVVSDSIPQVVIMPSILIGRFNKNNINTNSIITGSHSFMCQLCANRSQLMRARESGFN